METINQQTCVRCGQSWYPRKPGRPNRCGKCGALYWDRPARVKRERKVGPPGRPPHYPQLDALHVGDSTVIPWCLRPDGLTPDWVAQASVTRAIRHYARTRKVRLITVASGPGVRVERVT